MPSDLALFRGQVPLTAATSGVTAQTAFTTSAVSSIVPLSSPSLSLSDAPSALSWTLVSLPTPYPPATPGEPTPTGEFNDANFIAVSHTTTADVGVGVGNKVEDWPGDRDIMHRPGKKCFAGFLAAGLTYITLNGAVAHITKGGNADEVLEQSTWLATSKSWLDRNACYWFGLCGVLHLNQSRWTWDNYRCRRDGGQDSIGALCTEHNLPDYADFWTSGTEDPASWSREETELREIPDYIFDHTPYVHLFSGENFWPCNLAEHLVHTTPNLNYTEIEEMKTDRNLSNLAELNDYEGARGGRFVYLKSDDNVEERPDWLGGSKNIPSTPPQKDKAPAEPDWPSLEDLKGIDLEAMKEQALLRDSESKTAESPYPPVPSGRSISPDGTCGADTGYTCLGSSFGSCCSWAGYCGTSEAYCGNGCDRNAGECAQPPKQYFPPHSDLRRRKRDLTKRTVHPGGYSDAPAVLVVVPKDHGIVDAFWFYFYSYNLGNTVLNVRFGNHVGDWEHSVVRFRNGTPDTMFLSEHNFGEAYAYHAMEKYPGPSNATQRPVIYSATGTHAMYATPGLHPYVIPWGLLKDETDRGPLWDPLLNSHAYTFDLRTSTLRASTRTPKAPTEWFSFRGHWGDKYYPLSDPRQYRFAGQYHYVNGPLGPRFKNLGRKNVCQGHDKCVVKHWLGGGRAGGITLDEHHEDREEGGEQAVGY